MNPPRLRDGIPLRSEYAAVLESGDFEDMRAFSEAFVERNRTVLGSYIARWGAENPLRSWSRQWEYPYVFGQVAEMVRDRPRARILDAGSGATFMPFHLASRFEGTTVSCCDSDGSLEEVFASLNRNMDHDIEFTTADKSSLANRRLVRWPPLLTVCCLSGRPLPGGITA